MAIACNASSKIALGYLIVTHASSEIAAIAAVTVVGIIRTVTDTNALAFTAADTAGCP